jgi:ribonuclease Z
MERVRALIYEVVLRNQTSPIPINLNEIERGGLLYQHKDFTVSAFPVVHRGRGCYGFVFQERDHRPFLNDQAQSLGVPFGPERSQLVRGESITLADGRTITPEMVLGETIKGTKLVFTGDVAQVENLREVVKDADALVIEATFVERDRDMAASYGHITAAQAARLAVESNVKGLLLTHISRRYGEKEMMAEARAIFPSAFVVRDLDHYRVGRTTPLTKIEKDKEPVVAEDELDEGGLY